MHYTNPPLALVTVVCMWMIYSVAGVRFTIVIMHAHKLLLAYSACFPTVFSVPESCCDYSTCDSLNIHIPET